MIGKGELKWEAALGYGELKLYKDGVYYNVDMYGDKRYWKDGLRHREDGPAVEYTDGYRAWFKDGKLHREDGPAKEWSNGYKQWWIKGVMYKEEEYKEKIKMIEMKKDPKWEHALKFGELKEYKDDIYYNISRNGDKRYWKDGKCHREDGPAVESVNGANEWWKNGKLHRLDGPAKEWSNGYKQWWIEGVMYKEEEYKEKIKMIEMEKDSKWEAALSYGALKLYKDEVYYNVNKCGDKHYWKDGKLHRDDGPAVEYAYGYGYKGWFIEGVAYKEEEYKEKIKIMEFEKDSKWENALYYGELKHYKDDIYYNVDRIRNKRYWKDGKLHRDDGPAIDHTNGRKAWYKKGKRHREDGPAVECANGDKEWYKEGKRHRDDGPAVECANGDKEWWIEGKEYREEEYKEKIKNMEMEKDSKWKDALYYGELKGYKDDIYYNVDKFGDKRYWKDGLLHREDGPAVEWADGDKIWYKEGKYHREDGPAMEYADCSKEWYIEGKAYTEEEYKEKIKMMEIEKDPKWERALSYGELKHYKDEVYYNVDRVGNKRYWKDGKIHREDGPALEHLSGDKAWWKEDKRHRLDGPAVELVNGYKEWWIEGVMYKEEEYKEKIKMMEFEKDSKWNFALSYGELKEYKDEIYYNLDEHGNKRYWKDGKIHRDDGPAIDHTNGRKAWYKEGKRHKAWYKEGKRHREDGPAVERENGDKEWWIEGKRHRDDGPAVECSDGKKRWFIEDIQYTEEEFKKKIKIMEFEKDRKWKDALYYGELKGYKDDIYYNVDKFGDKRYWKDGKLHRDDGPAIEWENGDKSWYKEGLCHRAEYKEKIKMMQFEKDPKWEAALRYGELEHYKDDIYYNVDRVGNKRYWKDGKIHREDGPALEHLSGDKAWGKENKYHRLDGPAIEWANGSKSWWIEGVRYTEEEFNKKIKIRDGKLHREDGPAIEWRNGDKSWWKEDKRHRLDGPAVELVNGYKEWWIEGEKFTEEEFKKKIKIMEIEKDPKWKEALKFGELKHYKDEVYYNVDRVGNKRYWKDGLIHRDDGPSVEYKNGDKGWCKEGKRHRLDGPAIECADGRKYWYIEGEKYTEEEFNKKVGKTSGNEVLNRIIAKQIISTAKNKINIGVPSELAGYLLLGVSDKFGEIGREIRVEILSGLQGKIIGSIKEVFKEMDEEEVIRLINKEEAVK